jgi:dTDP-4-dehydrorhamnose 3,5-epimerase-like enzyme
MIVVRLDCYRNGVLIVVNEPKQYEAVYFFPDEQRDFLLDIREREKTYGKNNIRYVTNKTHLFENY